MKLENPHIHTQKEKKETERVCVCERERNSFTIQFLTIFVLIFKVCLF